MKAAAETYAGRNALYGDNYKRFGEALAHVLPHNKSHLMDGAAWTRMGLVVQILSKLMRYCANIDRGGHKDSAHDMMVYAAMLEECTDEKA